MLKKRAMRCRYYNMLFYILVIATPLFVCVFCVFDVHSNEEEVMEGGVLREDEFQPGEYVSYDFIIPSTTPDGKAEKIMRNLLKTLKRKWSGRVKAVRIDLFLGENYIPFIRGMWVDEESDRNLRGITVEFDEDGKYQTEEQTKILTSERRKSEIFYEIIECEDRAHEEAYDLYPTDMVDKKHRPAVVVRNIKKSAELFEKYKEELSEKYGLSVRHLDEIAKEGIRKNWPMP